MLSDKTLLIFTSAFPFGKSETFLETELPFLVKAFAKVIIVHNETHAFKRNVSPQIELVHFPYSLTSTEKRQALKGMVTSVFWTELFRLYFRYKRKLNKGIFATMTLSLYKAQKLTLFLEKLLQKRSLSEAEVILYAYWCNDMALGLSLFKKKYPKTKAISRAHGWDVYFEVSQYNYLPFRKPIFTQLDAVLFISEYGKSYVQAMNQDVDSAKMKLARLGVDNPFLTSWQPPNDTESTVRIVSCSNLIPLKRIDLLVDSLSLLAHQLGFQKTNIQWVHFGDGPEMENIEQLAAKHLKGKVEYQLKGRVVNQAVLKFYSQHNVTVFINLSTSEGVPVSIMEAMAFGIPVIATHVGGVPEIVNEENGYLLSANPTKNKVAHALRSFLQLSKEERNLKRKAAWETWRTRYNAAPNYEAFAKELKDL